MHDELVLDASVAAAVLFEEEKTVEAVALIDAAARLIAPEFIFAEVASIGAKKVRRGLVSPEGAESALELLAKILSETVPTGAMAKRSMALAIAHGFSAYDGLYLALAEAQAIPLATVDMKLAGRARAAGLGHLIATL